MWSPSQAELGDGAWVGRPIGGRGPRSGAGGASSPLSQDPCLREGDPVA